MRHPLFEFLQALPPYGWLFRVLLLPPRLGEPQLQSATGRSGRAWGRLARSLISYARGRTIPGFAGKKMRAEPGVALMNELGH